jgi:hypothetical protein
VDKGFNHWLSLTKVLSNPVLIPFKEEIITTMQTIIEKLSFQEQHGHLNSESFLI